MYFEQSLFTYHAQIHQIIFSIIQKFFTLNKKLNIQSSIISLVRPFSLKIALFKKDN